MVIKVGINGYGTIGKRVADAVAMQKDMKVVGVTAHSYSFNTEVAKKKGRKQIELWTHETNSRAQRLYKGKGFKLTGEKKKAENTNEWIVHYSLNI